METTTFITIHDLSPEAHILYSSDSIVDILGHTPDEVINRSCWDFFQRGDLDTAKILHERTVKFDKAAVLVYCSLLHRNGEWVNCECCFTCVYNVMVVCTSIYRPNASSQKRATEAPIVRRLFSSSPQDPRYHMLSHLSAKFQKDIGAVEAHEPRAALFLNRFTRTATVMYATSGIEQIIGITGENMKGRSFYFCIAENCLEDAVNCIENAKANDSIAYLRFWYRDPRQDDDVTESDASEAETDDVSMTDVTDTEGEEEEEGGVRLDAGADLPRASTSGSASTSGPEHTETVSSDTNSGTSSGLSNGEGTSSTESAVHPERVQDTSPTSSSDAAANAPIELEAVVSCTSDGLVVIIRRARPLIPGSVPSQIRTGGNPLAGPAHQPLYAPPQGIFAAPWAVPQPFFAPHQPRPAAEGWWYGMHPQYIQPAPRVPAGPSPQDFMNSIRDVAAFAWGVVGINGNLSDYGRGQPAGDSQPVSGLPIWDPQYREDIWAQPDSGNVTQSETGATTSPDPFGSRAGSGGGFQGPTAS